MLSRWLFPVPVVTFADEWTRLVSSSCVRGPPCFPRRRVKHTGNAPPPNLHPLHRLYDKDAIAAAQEKESQQPLTLAELFRQTLCFIDEEVCAEVV
jgi:hypothetical protein